MLVHVDVECVDAALALVEQTGGSAVHEKMPVPSVGWTAHVRDSEGDLIGLFQNDESATAAS